MKISISELIKLSSCVVSKTLVSMMEKDIQSLPADSVVGVAVMGLIEKTAAMIRQFPDASDYWSQACAYQASVFYFG